MFSFSQSENPNPNSFELFLFFIHLKMKFSLNFFTDKSFLVFKAWNQSQFLLEILEKFCYHISSAEYSLYFFLRISCAESEKVITANSTSIWSLTFAYIEFLEKFIKILFKFSIFFNFQEREREREARSDIFISKIPALKTIHINKFTKKKINSTSKLDRE
jgi:hypothetical protein